MTLAPIIGRAKSSSHLVIEALRAEFKKSTPNPEVIERIESDLAKQENKSQEIFKANETSEKAALELKSRIDVLELELARAGGVGDTKNYRDSEEYKSLQIYCMKGEDRTPAEVKALLRTDNDVSGGFLAPIEMDNTITKKITEISNVRAVARVRTVAAKALEMPVRNTIPTATYEGEAEDGADSTSTYQTETLTPFRQTVTVPVTQDMLMDAAFDMESEIFGDVAESFAQNEGALHVAGTGVKQPFGFLSDTRVQATARTSTLSGSSNLISSSIIKSTLLFIFLTS